MTTGRTAERPHVLFCNCVALRDYPASFEGAGSCAGLSQTGLEIEAVDDLCGLAAHHDPRLQTGRRTLRWLSLRAFRVPSAGCSTPPGSHCRRGKSSSSI